jgi:MscS family membrane protein
MEKFLFEESHFISAELAAFLKQHTLFMANWKWGVLLIGWALGFALRPLLQFVLKKIKEYNLFAKKFPKSFLAYFFKCEIERPISWILIILFWFGLNDGIELSGKFLTYYEHLLRAFMAIQIMHLAYYGVDALGDVLKDIAAKTENTMDDYLVPFANKTLKILVVVLGILLVLQSFGLNVMSLMAGLGLGGLP